MKILHGILGTRSLSMEDTDLGCFQEGEVDGDMSFVLEMRQTGGEWRARKHL